MLSVVQRISPLADIAIQGRFGADRGMPGIYLSVRHPVSIVTVMTRKGKSRAFSDALREACGFAAPAPGRSATGRRAAIHWAGFEQYYVVADGYVEGELYSMLADTLAGIASCADQSHGRVIVRIGGPKVRQVLAKGTPVDLHPSVFEPGHCAVTQMAHVGVHLVQTGADAFELSVFRGFAESFWEWLTEQAEEFGYQVG
jgi:sarcosine oxidase subunit gamma